MNYIVAHQETPDGKLIIEGKFVPSDRVDKLLRLEEPVDHEHKDGKPCYLCRLNLDIKHTVNSTEPFIFFPPQ